MTISIKLFIQVKYDVGSSLSCRFMSTLLFLTGGSVPMQSASVWVQRAMLRGREHAAGHHEGQSQQPIRLRHGHQAKGDPKCAGCLTVSLPFRKTAFCERFQPFFSPHSAVKCAG